MMRIPSIFSRSRQGNKVEEDALPVTKGEARSALISYLNILEAEEDRIMNDTDAIEQVMSRRQYQYPSYDTNDLQAVVHQAAEELRDQISRFRNARVAKKVAPPASDEILSSLPRVRILRSDRSKFQHDTTSCGVCCENLIDGAALMRLPCGHIFHINCGVSWLSRSCTCPECRYEVGTSDKAYEPGRKQRMEGRKIISCSCHPSTIHSCFFVDPSKPIDKQLTTESC